MMITISLHATLATAINALTASTGVSASIAVNNNNSFGTIRLTLAVPD